jgi:4,5-DOPA dioxygenase extradiol
MNTFPAIFISHGGPDLPLSDSPARNFLSHLGQELGTPKGILVISAHWCTEEPVVSLAVHPQTIHDFSGFPAVLYELQYPAPGAVELGDRTAALLRAAGIVCHTHPSRGLDHGAWNPLLLMYPEANIPVTQLSVQPHQDPAYHRAIGQAIRALREEGYLVLASGAATHNLRDFGKYDFDSAPVDYAKEFQDWLTRVLVTGETTELLNYSQVAPYSPKNHPTPEHFLPLFVALGAGNDGEIKQIHSSYTYGVLSMAAYSFA